MGGTSMKVGALARRTGLSVRALHHYDEIGLLAPSGRTRSGHRLYGAAEVRRLQQIASLRQLGLSLDDIRDTLAREEFTLDRVLEMQIERLRDEIDQRQRLCALLEHHRRRIADGEPLAIEDVTRTIEATTRFERHYTPEQLRRLARRREEVGAERIREVQEEWQELFDAFGRAMADGLDPACAEVRALARRSAALVAEFTGGDPGMRASLEGMYGAEGPRALDGFGMRMAPGLWEYMAVAREALAADKTEEGR